MTYTVRAPRHEDTKLILELVHAHDIAEYGAPDFEESDILNDWARSGFDMSRDAWMIFTEEGRLIGYGHLHHDIADSIEHPEFAGQGVWKLLLDLMEQRRLEVAEERSLPGPVMIKHWTNGRNERTRAFFLSQGYEYERTYYRMAIDFTEAPPAPVLPEGVTIRSFVKGQDDVEYHSVMMKGFAQHYDFREMPLADLMNQTELEGHHPDLWAMAIENGRMIGVVGGRIATDYNWIRRLCTLPEARGRGLGLALLQHSFRVGYDLGLKRASLGVDAQNETGALQLYLRVGMHVEAEHRRYVKTLANK